MVIEVHSQGRKNKGKRGDTISKLLNPRVSHIVSEEEWAQQLNYEYRVLKGEGGEDDDEEEDGDGPELDIEFKYL